MLTKKVHTFLLAAFAIYCFAFTGCASKSKIDWDGRIGTYSYDQAVKELGPPERASELSDGSRVAEWERDGGSSGMSFGLGTGYYGRSTALGFGTTVYPHSHEKYVLRLTFNKAGVLTDWVGERR